MSIFFDYASGSPLHPDVMTEMQQYFIKDSVNIASSHHDANRLRSTMMSALEDIGQRLQLDHRGLVVTSGATESINQCIIGAVHFYSHHKKVHLMTSKAEHSVSLRIFKYLESQGHQVTYIDVDQDGLIDLDAVKSAVRPDTLLASFHHINNETGVVQPVQPLIELLKSQGILVHIDASQSIGKVPAMYGSWEADYISFCTHKAQGPIGIGLLYHAQQPLRHFAPLIHGKGIGKRPGTFPMALFMGMCKAIQIAENNDIEYVQTLKNIFLSQLDPAICLTTKTDQCIPHIINLYCKDVFNDLMQAALPQYIFSTGSACNSQSHQPSHVLKAMGRTLDQIDCSLRISFHHMQSKTMVKTFAQALNKAYFKLTKLLPDEY